LAFSPCPNDTFIFNALVNGQIEPLGFSLQEVVLEDVETLNRWALEGRYDISKISFHAYGHVRNEYKLLEAGAALGRGCGPLLVTSGGRGLADIKRVAIPGELTTAALLLGLYLPGVKTSVSRFDKIMGEVSAGEVDAGVIIHESRFTYQECGLELLVDLGSWWESETKGPIPLGGIVIKRSLGPEAYDQVNEAIRRSLLWARKHRDEGLSYIKGHAQELSLAVIDEHIGLYVNDYSLRLGESGRRAVDELLERGRASGIFSGVSP